MSVRVRLEFLDGTACILELPVWHRDSQHLIAAKPGTIEDIDLYYVGTTRRGLRVYRERPLARIIRFPLERVRKSANS